MQVLARRLLALEAASQAATDMYTHESVRVFDKLRTSLGRFAGPEGFASLLRRALTLARADVPHLPSIKVQANGSVEGLEQLADDGGADAAAAITAHLLGLLVTFVGEPLTLRLVRDAWPDASLSE